MPVLTIIVMLYEIRLIVSKPGSDSPTKEHYIADALLHGEAEKTGYELYPNTDVDVISVCRSDIKEIVNAKEEDKPFFKATVIDVVTDDLGREKEMKYQMLVCAKDIADATSIMTEHLKQGYDMRLDAIRRVKILDYIQQGQG